MIDIEFEFIRSTCSDSEERNMGASALLIEVIFWEKDWISTVMVLGSRIWAYQCKHILSLIRIDIGGLRSRELRYEDYVFCWNKDSCRAAFVLFTFFIQLSQVWISSYWCLTRVWIRTPTHQFHHYCFTTWAKMAAAILVFFHQNLKPLSIFL